ncbi:DUF4870 domain-containing protein [Micromonospora sp. WP24]|uniref:DUF4870 domain-containing protein n=1 Tax=Micromonospora TaxID=1873 RepID=UPI0011DB9912|nr:DUF4870 domain-containing protein [Micromonospora sp. WP24]TYB98372.1 DUF4870 domain-containing protein [Micromonospora sp. WP24]
MTEPPRPPGAADPGDHPDPTPPPAAPGPSAPDEPTAPLSGSPGPAGYPPPGGYPPPSSGQPPSGGYPPPGGYPPGAGYPTGGGYGPPAGYASNEDKTWALVAHFGGALGALISFGPLGFVAPLIAYLARGQQSPAVRAQALAALNFQILWSGIAFVLLFVSWCLLFLPSVAVVVIQIAFGVIAGMKANEGNAYRYPMSANFIK